MYSDCLPTMRSVRLQTLAGATTPCRSPTCGWLFHKLRFKKLGIWVLIKAFTSGETELASVDEIGLEIVRDLGRRGITSGSCFVPVDVVHGRYANAVHDGERAAFSFH